VRPAIDLPLARGDISGRGTRTPIN